MKQFIFFTFACLTLSSASFLSRGLQEDPNVAVIPPTDPNAPLPEPQPVQPQPPVINRPLFPPLPVSENVVILERFLTGLRQQVGVQEGSNLSVCLDDRSAKLILKSLKDFYGKLASKDWLEIPGLVNKLRLSYAPAVPLCLGNDQGVEAILDAYGLDDESFTGLFLKVATFAFTADYSIVGKNFTDIKEAFKRGQYEIAGVLTGQLIQTVLGYDPETGTVTPPENQIENEEEEEAQVAPAPAVAFMRNLGWGSYDEEDETSEDGEYDSGETGDYLYFISV